MLRVSGRAEVCEVGRRNKIKRAKQVLLGLKEQKTSESESELEVAFPNGDEES